MSITQVSSMSGTWWRERLACDLPASIVVFLVALPLSMGIAIASGVPVTAGLVTGIVGGVVAGALAGAPLQVSGPAAGLTVIVFQCIRQYGIEELGVVVLLAGLLQVLAGILHLGQWFRAVSPAVVQGMLAGIGVLIVCSQFHVMVDDKPKQHGIANMLTIPEAVSKAIPWRDDSESALQRTARTRLLKQTGMLHLQQTEIGEQVQHLLTGIAVDQTLSAATQRTVESPSADGWTAAELAAIEKLRGLAASQASILKLLGEIEPQPLSDEFDCARQACRQALVGLMAGNFQTARASQDRADKALAELRDSAKSHRWAAGLGILTIVVLVTWQATFARRLRFLPAPLIAVIVATLVAGGLDLPVLYVEVPDNLLEEIYVPTLAELKSVFTPGLLLVAVQIAVIASAETLLCATAVDQMHQGPRTRYDRELVAQGVGNMVCGLLAALPMTGVIVRSSANLQAGAKSHWSAVLHGVWLLLFVVALSFLLRMIPTASLAAILVYTGYKLVNPNTIKTLLFYGKGEAAIYVATMVAIVLTDLLAGVLFGIGLSIFKLVYAFSSLQVTFRKDPKSDYYTLVLNGSATFLRLPKLAMALEQVAAGSELHVNFDRLTYIDHACLELLSNWQKQYEAPGGKLVIDWTALTARFRADPASSVPSRKPVTLR